MEGGQKTPINLEAGLNINTSDMLTPLASQTFQHNWQKFQGKFLPNSLRFEKNGWAAGWNVYNFDYNTYRKKQGNMWLGMGQFNNYVKTVSLYNDEKAYDPIYTVYVVPKTAVTVGNVTVSGNTITGKVKDKPFSITWDPVAHVPTCTTENMQLDYTINSDYSVTMKVTDLSSAFNYDFILLLPGALQGDSISSVSYSGFTNNEHKWGQYSYNISTGKLYTPDGVEVTPTVSGNTITFDYTSLVNNETEDFYFTLKKYYMQFRDISKQDYTWEDKLLLGANPATGQNINYYRADLSSRVLQPNDTTGIEINWKLPVWWTATMDIDQTAVSIPMCNNTLQREIATNAGNGVNMSGVARDINGASTNITITEGVNPTAPKYITGLTTRFKEILLNNTLELSAAWHPAHTVINNEVWCTESRQYKNLYEKNTALMTKYLGDIYTWGTFSFDPSTLVEPNNPYDTTEATNILYTQEDISGIYSYKERGSEDNTDEGDDNEFIENLAASHITPALVATATGSATPYSPSQTAKSYSQLYDASGKYIGGTYETVPVTATPFWPFSKVPKYVWEKKPITYDSVSFIPADNPSEQGWYVLSGSSYNKATDTVARIGTNYFVVDSVAASPVPTDNPSSNGWYERSGNNYIATADTLPVAGKTYYILNISSASVDTGDNPQVEGWYELSGGVYTLSTDTSASRYKTYYEQIPAEIIADIYWTDGDTYIDNIYDFMSMVLGVQDISVDRKNDYTSEDPDYNRTRVVKQYKAGFDFDFISRENYSDVAEYQRAVNAWNTTWSKYYPDLASPQEIFNAQDTNSDNTYLDFNEIEIIRNVDPQISYVKPGVYVSGRWAIPFGDASGIIPYTGSLYELTPKIYHQATDKTEDYIVNTQHEAGFLRSADGEVVAELPFYFGQNMATTVLSGATMDTTYFVQNTKSVTAKSAKLTIGVGYTKDVVHKPDHDEWEWNLAAPGEKVWVSWMLASCSNGEVTLRNGPHVAHGDSIMSAQYTVDANGGLKISLPVWANSATRLTYPTLRNEDNINNADALILETIPTSELTDSSLIYFDRDDTDKSLKLFDIVKYSCDPDLGESKGNICLSLESIGNNTLWYSPKQYDESGRTEIPAPYIIPGIAWGDVNRTDGYMKPVETLPILKLNWRADIYKYPISAIIKFSGKNTRSLTHRFFTIDRTNIDNVEYTIGDISLTDYTRKITVAFPGGSKELIFNGPDQKLTIPATTLFENAYSKVTCDKYEPIVDDSSSVHLPIVVELYYNNNTAKFIKLSDYTLVSSDGNNCIITDGNNTVKYNIGQQSVLEPATGVTANVTSTASQQHITINGSSFANITAYLAAAYDGVLNGTEVTFQYNGVTYSFDFKTVVNTGIAVLSTDIRKPGKTKSIGNIKTEGQYQFLKQQWNTTVEVENFWWVDSKHVLELNQFDFVLKRNTEELDDWNGNRFESVYSIPRENILPTNIKRYFVTNAYKSAYPALLCTLQEQDGEIKLVVMNTRRKMSVVTTKYIQIVQHQIGELLNENTYTNDTAIFNTYNPLTVNQLLSAATWSSTIVGNFLIIGCHLSNNFDQWAAVINLNTAYYTSVIQGYGFVGLHGELTGGQIPTDYFNVTKGFSDKVEDLSVLLGTDKTLDPNDLDSAFEVGDADKVNNITNRVVGNNEQQWYISKKLHGIVSHLLFDDGIYTKQILPITNNYTSIYKSPSFMSSVLGDSCIQATPFSNMFTFEGAAAIAWTVLMQVVAGSPLLYSLAPRYAQLVYLQQTFGQYAYVHYNSSKSLPEEDIKQSNTDSGMSEQKNKQTNPVLSSSFVFDKQKFSQQASTEAIYTTSILMLLIGAFADNLQMLDKKQSVNEEQNQTATSDIGKKFVDNAVANTGDMLASAIVTQSKNDSGVTSVVAGLKSLDMFYSTSDQQHIYAGPGFVEHQFVADCVAQSVTDTQLEGKVQQLYFCIRSLTTVQVNVEIKLEELAADALDVAADATAAVTICGTNAGAPVAIGMHATAAALRAAAAAKRVALQELDKIFDAICARGITVNVDSAVTRHALSVEGKHKYGEKNEVFMWPCFGIQPGQIKYTDEWVDCGIKNTPWQLALNSSKYYVAGGTALNAFNFIMTWGKPQYSSNKLATIETAKAKVGDNTEYNKTSGWEDFDEAGDTFRAYRMQGRVPFYQAAPFGKIEERTLPDDMACIEGVARFLPDEPFKNENIGQSDPAFAPSMQQDYIIDKSWDLSQYCTYGMQQWVAVKDTKIIDCPPSNIVVDDSFCGVACPYTAIEVKRGIEKAYMRPWAITPNTLAFNCTGYNTILQDKLYHAFDGISYRIVSLIGSPGMNKNRQSFFYSFQINDRFKRSNKVPANELQGNFESEPIQALDTIDKTYTLMTVAAKEKGLEAGTVGEDKDLIRWAVPVFTEHVSTLPAAVKTMTAMTLGVVEGVTSLCVDLANNQVAYKAPLSVDFTIGKNVYRATEEYICSVQTQDGIDIVTDLIPSLGLKYIGSTPTEAYFYSKSTRCYYSFTGSSLTKMDMMERFRDVQKGYWDFVNQEVVMPCLMTFKRLNAEVEDKDTETDNIIVPVLSKNQVSGELPPPITTIFNDRSWYKCVSLPCGFAYQGPNRVIINRAVFCEYMEQSIKSNYGKWKKMNREKYTTQREYIEQYHDIMKSVQGIDGWTYNPFVLVTSALGQSEDTDCIFEWNITFCWPVEMDLLYGTDNYATVNIVAETMTQGGKITTRPTHIFLTKELFTRNGNYGYYSFRFQSKNGMGNRERLHIWSDQYIAISSVECECKSMTQRRNEQLTQQVDITKLKEL